MLCIGGQACPESLPCRHTEKPMPTLNLDGGVKMSKDGFVQLTWKLLNSKQYINLSFASSKLLPYFLGKVKCDPKSREKYETEFRFSYTEGQRLGFARETFRRCIKELQAAGFIRRTKNGGLKGDGYGYNWYVLSRLWETKYHG